MSRARTMLVDSNLKDVEVRQPPMGARIATKE